LNAAHLPSRQIPLMVNLGLLLVGSFPPAAIMILTPLLLPMVRRPGVNPVHFRDHHAVKASIGMYTYTPPFGLNSLPPGRSAASDSLDLPQRLAVRG
jgi:TRAP-type C4-dicarboxylate transport system permease large subunit